MDGDINQPVFDFDLTLLNDGDGESVDVNEYLNLPLLTPLMSVPCDGAVTYNPGDVQVHVQTQQQEQDLFNNTWCPTPTSVHDCGGTDNDRTTEPEESSRPKRGRPRSQNPKNPENTKRLREQRVKDKKKKLTFKQELEALRREVAELERDEALMSELISESQEIYIGMIQTGEL